MALIPTIRKETNMGIPGENGVQGAGAGGASGAKGDQTLLTRYRIFKTDDGGLTLKYLGHQDAKNSDDALRKFFPADTVGHYAATSENHFKIRHLTERPGPVVASEPIPWPEAPAPAVEEPTPAA